METHETTEGTAVSVRRRTVLKGAAWTAPAVVVLGTTRAYADSPTFNEIASHITQGNSPTTSGSQAAFVVSGVGVAGQTVSVRVTATGFDENFPGPNVDSNGQWSFTLNLSGVASFASVPQGTTFTFTPTIGGTDSSPNSRTAIKDTVAVVTLTTLVNGATQNTAVLSGTLESSASPSSVQVVATTGNQATPPTFPTGSLALPGWSSGEIPMKVNDPYRFWIRAVDSLGNVNIYNTSAFIYRNNTSFTTPTLALYS